uniref:Reverse transcriptase Ty1/copia-type domain-containing protein n=1 Tax=Fagus sylvatica TaxID=28930 RepID=A0A2N9J7Q6_FAGSY
MAINASIATVGLVKFNGTGNFGLWQRRVKDLLVQQGLVKALYGKTKKLEKMTDDEWEELDMKAVSTIRLLADDVMEENSTAGIWLNLEKRYMSKSLTNKLHLKQKLYGLKMTEGADLRQHINTFKQIISDMLRIDIKFEDEDKAMMLLTSLPTSYEHLVTTLLYGKEIMELKEVSGALLDHYQWKHKDLAESSGEGLVVKGYQDRGRKKDKDDKSARGRSKSKSKTVKYFKCQKKGHIKSINCGSVRMGNDATCTIIGMGTIKIKMSDGVVRTLEEVRHIPDIRKNLISLGTLDSKGYSYKSENGIMKVSKGCYGCDDRDGDFLKFCEEHVDMACYIINRSPRVALDGKVAEEVWTGQEVDYSFMRIFGCSAYVHILGEGRLKLNPKSKKCIFLGFKKGVKGYKLWDPVAQKVVINRDVVFDEKSMTKAFKEEKSQAAESSNNIGRSTVQVELDELESQSDEEPHIARILLHFKEAIESSEKDKWMEAMVEENESLSKNKTWELTELPKGKKSYGLHTSIRAVLALVADQDLEFEQLDVKTAFLHGNLEEEIFMKNYIKKVLEKFSMLDAKPVSTPLANHFRLSGSQCPKNEEEIENMSKVPYASAVGCLMYAMVCTRPDLAHAVSTVSRYMANPEREHWNAVKWIFRYLKGTAKHGILFSRQPGTNSVVGYVDADYAGEVDDRRSTTGYVFTLSGGPICWKSTLQSIVAMSTIEVEYMAVAEAAKEALWLKGLVKELGLNQGGVQMHCDSQSAIYLAKNQVCHAKMKHIDVRFHKIRELIVTEDIVLEKVHTSENAADMLTKPVSTAKFKHCLDLVNVSSL